MFGRARKDKLEKLDAEMSRILADMSTYGPDSPEYPTLLRHLERVSTIRKSHEDRWKVSPDTLAIIAGNLLGIGLVVGYERMHVVTSKAFGNILKSNNQHH